MRVTFFTHVHFKCKLHTASLLKTTADQIQCEYRTSYKHTNKYWFTQAQGFFFAVFLKMCIIIFGNDSKDMLYLCYDHERNTHCADRRPKSYGLTLKAFSKITHCQRVHIISYSSQLHSRSICSPCVLARQPKRFNNSRESSAQRLTWPAQQQLSPASQKAAAFPQPILSTSDLLSAKDTNLPISVHFMLIQRYN